jgi:spermidine synthase
MLFLNGDMQIAEEDADIYNRSLVLPLVEARGRLNQVAILGCGDGGVLYELLRHKPKKVVVVDIDEEVIKTSKRFLRSICGKAFNDPRVEVIINDANQFLKTNHGFDAIIYDLIDHPESLAGVSQAAFFNNILLKIRNSLNQNGMMSMQCCSELDFETLKLLKKILPKYFRDISFRQSLIPSFGGNWIFASARVK